MFDHKGIDGKIKVMEVFELTSIIEYAHSRF